MNQVIHPKDRPVFYLGAGEGRELRKCQLDIICQAIDQRMPIPRKICRVCNGAKGAWKHASEQEGRRYHRCESCSGTGWEPL